MNVKACLLISVFTSRSTSLLSPIRATLFSFVYLVSAQSDAHAFDSVPFVLRKQSLLQPHLDAERIHRPVYKIPLPFVPSASIVYSHN
jgi:hypothetical protein